MIWISLMSRGISWLSFKLTKEFDESGKFD